jgi:hypothetical protein
MALTLRMFLCGIVGCALSEILLDHSQLEGLWFLTLVFIKTEKCFYLNLCYGDSILLLHLMFLFIFLTLLIHGYVVC